MTLQVRLAHWAEIMRVRKESGQTVRAWCRENGVVEKTYYYWQRKLRKAVSDRFDAVPAVNQEPKPVAPGFTEVKLIESPTFPALPDAGHPNQLHIEIGEIRITAGSTYPAAKLAALLRELRRPC